MGKIILMMDSLANEVKDILDFCFKRGMVVIRLPDFKVRSEDIKVVMSVCEKKAYRLFRLYSNVFLNNQIVCFLSSGKSVMEDVFFFKLNNLFDNKVPIFVKSDDYFFEFVNLLGAR